MFGVPRPIGITFVSFLIGMSLHFLIDCRDLCGGLTEYLQLFPPAQPLITRSIHHFAFPDTEHVSATSVATERTTDKTSTDTTRWHFSRLAV
jgi:hypothetical protein